MPINQTDVLQNLMRDSFGPDALWNSYYRIGQVSASGISVNLKSIYNLAMIFGFMLAGLQVCIILWKAAKEKRNAFEDLITYLFFVGFTAALLSPPVYHTFVKYAICRPPDAIANQITVTYASAFIENVSKLIGSFSSSQGGVLSFVKSIVDGSIAYTFFAALIWTAAAVVIFILPYLQSMLMLFLYFSGPLCLIFMFCWVTRQCGSSDHHH